MTSNEEKLRIGEWFLINYMRLAMEYEEGIEKEGIKEFLDREGCEDYMDYILDRFYKAFPNRLDVRVHGIEKCLRQ